MHHGCLITCERKNYYKGESNGVRSAIYYPGGGNYKGAWLNTQHHGYGKMVNKNNLVYEGQWMEGKRHGQGTVRRTLPSGRQERVYIGNFRNGTRCGEGKQFYPDGVYYGWWKENRRHGLGIKWFKDGSMYVGEWERDVPHGVGIHFYVNGNRYEGHFARGFKNGEGIYFHNSTGQIQKGMWLNDVCKTSLVMDQFRNQVVYPTPYPIPPCELDKPDDVVRRFFRKYSHNATKPPQSLLELICLNFAKRVNKFIKLETTADPNIFYDNVKGPCPLRKPMEYDLKHP